MEKSCGAVIYKFENNEYKYLLLHQNNNYWSFPKGHIENNETEEETAIRETKEECNLDIIINTNFKEIIKYIIPEKNILKEAVYFIAKPITNDIKIDKKEINEYKWLNYNDAYQTLQFDNIKDVLNKAKNFLLK